MVFPDITNVLMVTFVLVPGFVTLMIIQKIGILEKKLSDFEMTIWSLFMSSILFVFFTFYKNLRTLEEIQAELITFENLFIINILGIIVGLASGVILRFSLRRGISPGTNWDIMFEKTVDEGAWINVQLNDGKEILGKIKYSSRGNTPREIVLTEPKIVKRNHKGEIDELIGIDGDVLINGKIINLITFFEKKE